MKGWNKRGFHAEWNDNVVGWCKDANLQKPSSSAQERSNRQKMMKQASNVTGH